MQEAGSAGKIWLESWKIKKTIGMEENKILIEIIDMFRNEQKNVGS